MDRHSDDVTAANDLELLQAARAGDRLAFGVLYLRHHAAAWRVACVASRFSPDAELAVIEGFTRVFSALPQESEEFAAGRVSFRPYLLACVRQAALDRARAAGRAEGPTKPGRRRTSRPAGPPAPPALAGLGPDGEVVLSSLEHHVVRGALGALPEESRTALWLTDVEAMTPAEVAGILGGDPSEIADRTALARAEVRAGREAALGRHEVRADCRFAVANVDAFAAGTLDPAKGVLVRSHLDICPPCRMRLGELANAPATLAAAVPAPPLLGGETQHHWLISADEIRPAERLLPPGMAAAAPAHRLPDVLRRAGRAAAHWLPQPDAIDLTTAPGRGSPGGTTSSTAPGSPGTAGSPDPFSSPGWSGAPGWSGSPTPSLPPAWTVPPGRASTPRRRDRRTHRPVLAGRLPALVLLVPIAARRAGNTIWPALPATVVVVAWLGGMLSLPHLMTPDTAPGPSGMALPAVQAYVPDYLPGAARPSARGTHPAPSSGGLVAGGLVAGGGAELASQLTDGSERASANSAGPKANRPSVRLIPARVSRPSHPTTPSSSPVANPAPPAEVAVVPVAVATAPDPAPTPTLDDPPTQPGKPKKDHKPKKHSKPGRPVTA